MALVLVRVASSKAMREVWFWDAFLVNVTDSEVLWLGIGEGVGEWATIPELGDVLDKMGL